ncbi:MAG TPA: alpha/beta hydrolase [Acidimicrobiales bacterium]|nr:alpha/beta hydrolase [Acidimicrobiales bacterium]
MQLPGRSRVVYARGTRIHLVEDGPENGPLVLLVHGFPESWYSWRHQIPVLAQAGYHAAAIDVRGYGRSSAPLEVEAYGMLHHVNDNLGVVEALGHDTAVVVGHDWGSPIAANSALLRPDVFTAVAMLSVPYSPVSSRRPTSALAELGAAAGEEFYIIYFQEPGRAEAEAETDVRGWLLGFLIGASGDAPRPPDGGTIATVPPGGRLRDRFTLPERLPGWLSDEDVDFYAAEFERTGFRGALNRYRNIDRDWRDLQAWKGRPIEVPSLFIGGERDGPTVWGANAISRFGSTLPGLRGSHVLPGCGHWVQQERPGEVNRLLLDWLQSL